MMMMFLNVAENDINQVHFAVVSRMHALSEVLKHDQPNIPKLISLERVVGA